MERFAAPCGRSRWIVPITFSNFPGTFERRFASNAQHVENSQVGHHPPRGGFRSDGKLAKQSLTVVRDGLAVGCDGFAVFG
jgi:hypothetical protein